MFTWMAKLLQSLLKKSKEKEVQALWVMPYMDSNEKRWSVYVHTSPCGKKYVGISCKRPEWRWNHGKGYYQNKHFFAAIQKYGWDNFQHDVVAEGLSKTDACSMERRLIEKYKTQNPEFGYNKSSGGELSGLGVKLTEEQKVKIGNRFRGENNPNYGKHLSEETRKKLSDAKFGSKHTEETRRKMSESHKGMSFSSEWRKHLCEAAVGVPKSEEHKAKLSKTVANLWKDDEYRARMVESHSGDRSHKAKKVLCVETGEVFGCIKYACNKYGLHSSSVSNVCRGKLKTTGGFHWRYVD